MRFALAALVLIGRGAAELAAPDAGRDLPAPPPDLTLNGGEACSDVGLVCGYFEARRTRWYLRGA